MCIHLWLGELKSWTCLYIDSEKFRRLSKYKLTDENSEDFSKNKLTEFIEKSEDLIRFFGNIVTVLIFIYLFLSQIYKDVYSFEDGRVF